jgi:hypothetical protein
VRGNANSDNKVDIADPIFEIRYMFLGGRRPDCFDAADGNDDGQLNLADPIWLLNYLFLHGPRPPAPFPTPGLDPTADGMAVCIE